jgi:hypothetical protein
MLFERITVAASRLLRSLETTAPPKNREEEAAKAKTRAAARSYRDFAAGGVGDMDVQVSRESRRDQWQGRCPLGKDAHGNHVGPGNPQRHRGGAGG